jgi:hypothetical protein
MSSLSILRCFPGSQTPETSPLSQNHKSMKFSSPEDVRTKVVNTDKKNRDEARTRYNKTAYGRDAVTILLIKTRTNLDIPLFDRISFKNIAVAKALYACLSNTKKTQYKTQAKQVIRSFLDQTKGFFNK